MSKKNIVIGIVGPTNSGKSTLLNNIIGEKLSIVTHKAQTTRSGLRGLKILGNTQMVFIDTPGIFNAKTKFEKAMDFYHTTISYFNSLREVGKTQSQIQTYILKEVRRVFSRVVRPRKLMHSIYTYGPLQESELTGRLSGEEVKNELKNVESKWKAKNRFANINNEELVQGSVPPEFIAATNMISVGLDVGRFNQILMNSFWGF